MWNRSEEHTFELQSHSDLVCRLLLEKKVYLDEIILGAKIPDNKVSYIKNNWASLVAQWLRICLPMQGTRVRALVWEDPTCSGATGPVSHNY